MFGTLLNPSLGIYLRKDHSACVPLAKDMARWSVKQCLGHAGRGSGFDVAGSAFDRSACTMAVCGASVFVLPGLVGSLPVTHMGAVAGEQYGRAAAGPCGDREPGARAGAAALPVRALPAPCSHAFSKGGNAFCFSARLV